MPSIPSALAARFKIGPELWSGSSGALYEVTEVSTNRAGVLKIVTQAASWTPAERGRLARELEKQATLSHPYLATPIAAGIADDVPWIFRQKIEGESLAQRIARGPLPVPEAVAIAAQLASGLDELHRAGLLQRDLSPGHVILTSNGTTLARVIDSGVATRIPSSAIFEVTGKPPYVSPEHAAGKLVSFRSDLYALGSILFEMLTGQALFSGTTEQVLEAQRSTPAPALTSVAPSLSVPGAITTLLGQLLAKEPRERPFSAQQVRRTLEPLVPEGALAHAQAPAPGAGPARGMQKTLVGMQAPKRPDATEELSALDLQQAAAALRPPPPRRDETMPLSALDILPAIAPPKAHSVPPPVPGSTPGLSVPPAVRHTSAPPPPPPASSSSSGEVNGIKRVSLPPPVPPGARTSSSGGLAIPPAPPSSPGVQLSPSASTSSPGGLSVPPAPPPPAPPAPVAAPVMAAPTSDLDYDDLAETNAVSREEFEQRQVTHQVQAINDLAPNQAPNAMPPLAAVAPQANGFGPTQMQPMVPMTQAQPQQGFGQPAYNQGFGGAPSTQPGFGNAPAQQGFGNAPAQPGFGNAPAQQGFGNAPAQQGFGQPQQGFGQPQQGFGVSSSNAGAPSPFGGTQMMPQTGMPMQQPMGGMPMQQPMAQQAFTPDEVPGMRRSRTPLIVLAVLVSACMFFSVVGVGGYMLFGRGDTTLASTPTIAPAPVAMQPMMPTVTAPPPTTVAPIAAIAPLPPPSVVPPTTIAPEPPPATEAAPPPTPLVAIPPATEAAPDPEPEHTTHSGSRPHPIASAPPPPTTTAPRSGLLASRIGPASPPPTTTAPPASGTGRLASRLGSAPPTTGGGAAPSTGGGASFDDLRARARAAFSAHHYDDAAAAYEQAARLQPSNAGVFAGLGAARLAGGNAAGAVTAYERAVQLQPSSAGYHAALGRAYATAGDRAHARSQYEEALRLDPDNRDAQTGMSRL